MNARVTAKREYYGIHLVDSGTYIDLSPNLSPRYGSFSGLSKTHVHISSCHSGTKNLTWVLERPPHLVFHG